MSSGRAPEGLKAVGGHHFGSSGAAGVTML